ncbi:MAG TPA: DNA-binding protein [Rikenellaceae bacterium]|nr:DNA-binding protein [Rikenellaceae bacterium]
MDGFLTVPINGLAQGRTDFRWRVGKTFFEHFENSEILAADLDIEVSAEKSGHFIGIDCDVCGDVTVACDRCLEELRLPVGTGFRLSVKFGQEPADSSDAEEGEREIVWLPESDADLDLGQIVYDYVCLSLPVQRVHPEGECNPDAVKFLSSEDEQRGDSRGKDASLPFASLKDLIDKVK